MSIVAFVTAVHHVSDAERALAPVHGEALLTHTVRGLLDVPDIDLVVVVAPERCAQMFTDALRIFPERCRIVSGSSVRSALDTVESEIPGNPVFLVHDVLRAFTPVDTIRAVADAIRAGSSVVVPILPMADTVKVTDDADVITGTEDRAHLRTAQTPIGLTRETLLAYTDGLSVTGAHTVPGHPDAMRVTSTFELKLAEAIAVAGKEETL